MYFLTTRLVELARQIFRDMTIEGPQCGDWFFETFGPEKTWIQYDGTEEGLRIAW